MINSKQLIELTGISRATLNNYVALGILPNPLIRTLRGEEGRATRLGYFEEDAVACIKKVQKLKKQGLSMAKISEQLGGHVPSSSPGKSSIAANISSSVAKRGPLTDLSLEASIENLPGPAYMVNNNFELIWRNDCAVDTFFPSDGELCGDLESRNLLKLLFNGGLAEDGDRLRNLLEPHIAAAKKRLSQAALMKVYAALDGNQLSILKDLYDNVEAITNEPTVHFPAILPGADGEPMFCDLYICFYREGILFSYNPVLLDDDFLLEFLSKRNHVINRLLKKSKPYLTNVSVMVAGIQNSSEICSELAAEEYFELINNIWQQSEAIFRKYYGTHGKHSGDGMVYYFFPQADCDYKLNAIQCSLELKQMMKGISQHWQSRKGWFSDIYLNIGLNAGQEWFGSYHAGGHVEFTVLGETINHASGISDFARNGSIWISKNMLNQISTQIRARISFGISRRTHKDETVFVTDTYASLGTLLDDSNCHNGKFRDMEMLAVTEIRDIDLSV